MFTDIVELRLGGLRHFTLTPENVGLPRVTAEQLQGGDGAANAKALQDLLAGQTGAYRDIVLFNAAAALIVAQKTAELRQGIALAAKAIDSGAAAHTLASLIRLTNEKNA